MVKYNLHCFRCGFLFHSKEEVYRDLDNEPICEDCLSESLDDEWESDYKDIIMLDITTNFNRNYKQFYKWFRGNHVKCDGDHGWIDWYVPKDEIIIINGKNYCQSCADEFEMEDIHE